MNRELFILIPAAISSGPIKGAYALANALVCTRRVRVVALRMGDGAHAFLDPRVERISLAEHGFFLGKLRAYRRLLKESGGRSSAASISMCFSADMLNAFCGDCAVTCASVRGNLPLNYRLDYGRIGLPLAIAHLVLLRCMDIVVTMTRAMAKQVARYSGRTHVIGNFVDEAPLERYRRAVANGGSIRFVFLASLTQRKMPLLAVRAVAELRAQGEDVVLDLIGSGPMKDQVEAQIQALDLSAYVKVHGFVAEPLAQLATADVLVVPSVAEGIARASLEALYLGVPCVLRNVDGNAELITPGCNGELFDHDSGLTAAMRAAARHSRSIGLVRRNLLPEAFRQQVAARSYLSLVEER